MRVVCSENVPPRDWDHRLYNALNTAGLCQSAYWARVLAKIDRAKPLFLDVCKDNDQDVVLSLLVFHKIPWNRHKNRRDYRSFVSFVWTGWLDWMDGPIYHSENIEEVSEAMDALLKWIETYAKKNRVTEIRACTTALQINSQAVQALFTKHGYISHQWATYLVDLKKDEDILWKELSHASRKCVNKSLKLNISVKKIKTLEEFKSCYYLPYCEIESALAKKTNPWSVAVTARAEDRECYYRYYTAVSSEGKTLAMLGMYMFNGVATEISSAISPIALEQKIPAQDLLHWHMLLDAKNEGCHTFDLAGVNPNPSNPKEEGIRRFKEKWGGRYVEFDRFEKTLPLGRISRFVRSLVRR